MTAAAETACFADLLEMLIGSVALEPPQKLRFSAALDPAAAATAAKSLQSCPTLCDPTDSSPPGSPVPGILQARTLEWVAISFSSTGLGLPLETGNKRPFSFSHLQSSFIVSIGNNQRESSWQGSLEDVACTEPISSHFQ